MDNSPFLDDEFLFSGFTKTKLSGNWMIYRDLPINYQEIGNMMNFQSQFPAV